jgi:leucyl/phenylalanyl-tRNA---protein transferase
MSSEEEDVVAVGGDLEPRTLVRAYRRGIFPWPMEGLPLLWFCPRERAILELAGLHRGRSLARIERQRPFDLTIDRAFRRVIDGCASTPRPGQRGTWITPQITAGYSRLHELGIAHSVEAWTAEGELVGGVYGVEVDGAFAAESMFYRRPYASRLALLHLLEHVASRGLDWIDVQVMTPHMERMGARAIPREDFLSRLAATRRRGLKLFD